MHDWDQPAEVLYALGPKQGTNLLMPQLGESVEPVHGHKLAPWWRVVDCGEAPPRVERLQTLTMPKTAPWPLD